jgi:hypothetical protein
MKQLETKIKNFRTVFEIKKSEIELIHNQKFMERKNVFLQSKQRIASEIDSKEKHILLLTDQLNETIREIKTKSDKDDKILLGEKIKQIRSHIACSEKELKNMAVDHRCLMKNLEDEEFYETYQRPRLSIEQMEDYDKYTIWCNELNEINEKLANLEYVPFTDTIFFNILEIHDDVCVCKVSDFFFSKSKHLKIGDIITIKKEHISYIFFGNTEKYITTKFDIEFQEFAIPEYWSETNYTDEVKELIQKNTIVRVIIINNDDKCWSKFTMKIINRNNDSLYGYSLNWFWEDTDVYSYAKANCVYKFNMNNILTLHYHCGQMDKQLGERFEELHDKV